MCAIDENVISSNAVLIPPTNPFMNIYIDIPNITLKTATINCDILDVRWVHAILLFVFIESLFSHYDHILFV